jgi:hypothetical protein
VIRTNPNLTTAMVCRLHRYLTGAQEFDDAEPVLFMLPVRLEIVFVLRCQDRQITL